MASSVHQGWQIRVFLLAVPPSYPTPFCAFAVKSQEPATVVGFNVEAATADQALAKAVQRIDLAPNLYEQIKAAGKSRRGS